MKKYTKSKKNNFKDQIIRRKTEEIDSLKQVISDLEIDRQKKDKMIDSIDVLRDEFIEAIDDLRKKSEDYEKLIKELRDMKKTMNQMVFHKRWKLIRFLLK